MKQKIYNLLLLVTAFAAEVSVAADFITSGGEVLRDAQLLKVVAGTVYLAHDGGIAALTPKLVAVFPAVAGAQPADQIKIEIEKWLIELKGGAPASTTGTASSSLLIVSAEKLAAYKKAVGEKYDQLEAGGGKVFTGVTITKVNQAYVYFSHSKGATRALISDLPPEWAERFDFSPVEAAAFIEDEQAKKELAADNLISATSGGIRIISALYGAENTWWDVRETLQNKINSGQTPVRVGSGSFGGDPIFGKVKWLIVKYSRNGQIIEIELREGETFLPNPSADAKPTTAPAPNNNTNTRSTTTPARNGGIIRSKRPIFVP
ncbi:MAG: hypothetical protein LBD30_05955 [Verrucomicrobiales bacterium]|nr:hypothetical protein [Verrucomicrobiales bacterium]